MLAFGACYFATQTFRTGCLLSLCFGACECKRFPMEVLQQESFWEFRVSPHIAAEHGPAWHLHACTSRKAPIAAMDARAAVLIQFAMRGC